MSWCPWFCADDELKGDLKLYITTFYSFKGGVGRTLALVNVAMELAKSGRRVLLVDFDLEAPGLDTFDELALAKPCKGIVDYVVDYISTGIASDFQGHVYEPNLAGKIDGRVWVMPAGKRDEKYASRLASIDWGRLYAKQNGFLLFEDLRNKWKECLNPDYVLIDSRTGHTEISGICTRQLPDSVVAMFMPNLQNLGGLSRIVSAIRQEERTSNRAIPVHFAVSNVPDLDDEEGILTDLLDRFRSELGFRSLAATIHRYDSLLLLKQSIFTLSRPKSRLSAEYRRLVSRIIRRNPEDREGAMRFLTTQLWRRGFDHLPSITDKTEQILKRHPDDPEILFAAAFAFRRNGLKQRFADVLEKAVALQEAKGDRIPAPWLLARADARIETEAKHLAMEDILAFLKRQDIDSGGVVRSLLLARRVGDVCLLEAARSAAMHKLGRMELMQVEPELLSTFAGAGAFATIIHQLLKSPDLKLRDAEFMKGELALACIATSQFEEALLCYGAQRPNPKNAPIQVAFNCAMAEWGVKGKPPDDLLSRIVELDQSEDKSGAIRQLALDSPNYHQCLAIVLFLRGHREDALARLSLARAMLDRGPDQCFSCWRYLYLPSPKFKEDLDEMGRWFSGQRLSPRFLQASDSPHEEGSQVSG